jgi:hypothetical protein
MANELHLPLALFPVLADVSDAFLRVHAGTDQLGDDPFSGFVRPLDLILGEVHTSSVDHDQPDFKGG